jgi:predicted ATP-grasp superfamily ATP-dependent carboligase
MRRDRRPIVVTQAHVRFGYNVARSLTGGGYQVIAAAPQIPSMCTGMQGVVGEVRHPDPFADPLGYVRTVAAAHERYGAGLFIPVHEDIFVASLLRRTLPESLAMLAPPFEALMALHDKYNLFLLTRGEEAGCPPTRLVAGHRDVLEAMEEFGAPVILKPRYGEGASGVFKLTSRSEAAKRAAELDGLLRREAYLAQKFFVGVGVGVGMLMQNGRVLATSQHLRLRESPLSGGASTARLTYDDARLRRATERLLARVGLSGVAMAEYRVDRESGRAHLLDLNPRYWGGLACHVECGVDYPRLHVESFWEGRPPASAVTPVRQVESRWALGEVRSFVALALRARWADIAAMVAPRHGAAVIYEDLSRDSWPAFRAQAGAYLRRVWRARSLTGGNPAKSAFFRAVAEGGAASFLAGIGVAPPPDAASSGSSLKASDDDTSTLPARA